MSSGPRVADPSPDPNVSAPSPDPPAAAPLRWPPPVLLLRLTAVAVAAPALVRAGLPRLQRWLEPSRPPPPIEAGRLGVLEDQMARWVDAVIRRGGPAVRPGCLTRGVTLYDALRRAGDDVALCFGVGTAAGQTAGHCWLDRAGLPILERKDPRETFTEVVRVSRSGVTH